MSELIDAIGANSTSRWRSGVPQQIYFIIVNVLRVARDVCYYTTNDVIDLLVKASKRDITTFYDN